MKKWVENTAMILIWAFIVGISAGLCFGFYYLIFVLAKNVFFG